MRAPIWCWLPGAPMRRRKSPPLSSARDDVRRRWSPMSGISPLYNSIRSVITPDLAAVSVVYIGVALVTVWAIDRLVGLEIFLKSR